MKRLTFIIAIVLMVVLPVAAQVVRPKDLKFQPLKYTPPKPEQYRQVLDNGLRTYIAEDASLPIVNVSAIVNYGTIYEGKDKLGLSRILQGTLIKGGTKQREGTVIEERIDFLGGTLNFNVGERFSTLSLAVLSKDIDEGLDLFFDVLMSPEFREDSLKLAKGRMLEQMRQANDSPRPVLEREFERLLYGEHPLSAIPLRSHVQAITQQDIKAVHTKFFFPQNTVLLASGDFKIGELKEKINARIKGWENKPAIDTTFPVQFPEVEPGIYFIQKSINQGYVNTGHLGIEQNNPDFFDVQVMNFILGGGSFTSRITSKVRSDEGLAYNTGSRFGFHQGFPGTFAGYVQTKSTTTGYAIELIKQEFERIRTQPVTDDEMETAKNFYLESLSEQFTTPMAALNTLAMLELQGRPMNFYQTYQDNIRKVTKQSVMEAAKKYIHPDKLVTMIVGDLKECNVTSEKFPHNLEYLGKIHPVKLIDQLTGEEAK